MSVTYNVCVEVGKSTSEEEEEAGRGSEVISNLSVLADSFMEVQ